jgi:flagellar hook-associated protein FlgK
MLPISSTALSGMNAAQVALGVSAGNIANQNTPGYRRQEPVLTAQAEGGVSVSVRSAGVEGSALETDIVNQLQAKNAFLANLAVFKVSAKMAGALLDERA